MNKSSALVMSRKKFFAATGLTVIASGLTADASVGAGTATGGVKTASEGSYLSKSFTGTLDVHGNMVFSHGLGASLPANILSVSAFIKLPGGKVRNVSVEYVDNVSIAVAAGVPHADVRVAVVYRRDIAS